MSDALTTQRRRIVGLIPKVERAIRYAYEPPPEGARQSDVERRPRDFPDSPEYDPGTLKVLTLLPRFEAAARVENENGERAAALHLRQMIDQLGFARRRTFGDRRRRRRLAAVIACLEALQVDDVEAAEAALAMPFPADPTFRKKVPPVRSDLKK